MRLCTVAPAQPLGAVPRKRYCMRVVAGAVKSVGGKKVSFTCLVFFTCEINHIFKCFIWGLL